MILDQAKGDTSEKFSGSNERKGLKMEDDCAKYWTPFLLSSRTFKIWVTTKQSIAILYPDLEGEKSNWRRGRGMLVKYFAKLTILLQDFILYEVLLCVSNSFKSSPLLFSWWKIRWRTSCQKLRSRFNIDLKCIVVRVHVIDWWLCKMLTARIQPL